MTFEQPRTSMLVFDIETVPFKDEEYSDIQKSYIQKKLSAALRRDPSLNPEDKVGELKGTDPYLSRVVCIGLYYPETGQQLALTNPDEALILQAFWDNIRGYNGLFVSYNGVKFDVPYIIRRSIRHGIAPSNKNFMLYTKYDPFPPHFDVLLQLSGGRENFYSLHEACDFFGVPSPKDGTIKASGVAGAYYAGRISEIADYCIRDLHSTYELYQKLRPYVTK
jgi:predicted PolB exonuclease-like 3'-5' exonuclease